MGKKFTITVVVDPDTHEIVVTDDDGNERALKSIMVFGGDAENGKLYFFGWGASADAAWAFKEGFLHAFEGEDTHYRSFYKQCACQIAQRIAPDIFRTKADAEERLESWSIEDLGRETVH